MSERVERYRHRVAERTVASVSPSCRVRGTFFAAALTVLLGCRESVAPTGPSDHGRPTMGVEAVGVRSPRLIAPRPTLGPRVTPANSYRIEGTVSDAATSIPISGATVKLIEFGYGVTIRGERLTDVGGRYQFVTSYCETCFLTADHPDYYGPAQAFAGTRGPATVVDFRLPHR